MIIKKSERKKYENSPTCIAYEYEIKDKDINIALIEINGRYPESGKVINKICKEIAIVIKGDGKVGIDDKEFSISEGDSIFIQPNQKFFWEGNLILAMSCHPAFYPEQHVECE